MDTFCFSVVDVGGDIPRHGETTLVGVQISDLFGLLALPFNTLFLIFFCSDFVWAPVTAHTLFIMGDYNPVSWNICT